MKDRRPNFASYLFELTRELDKPLVLGRDETTTYRELYEDVCKTADAIRRLAGGGSKHFLLCADNSVFFIKAYLSIILSGNICVPIDATLSAEGCQSIMDLLRTRWLVLQKRYSERFGGSGFDVVDEDLLAKFSQELTTSEQPPVKVGDDDVAVIIFTSGSTGRPKGVELSHANLYHNTVSIGAYLPICTDTIHEVVLPFHYCYGASILHTHIRCGASLVLNNMFMFPETVIEDINQYGCTALSGVPSTYQVLLRRTSFLKDDLASLKFMCQAGGKLPEGAIKQITSRHPDKDVYVMYGQTEATARLSYLPPRLLEEKIGSIGRGIPGVTLAVKDRNFDDVAPGAVGEIWARGGNVMRGYYQDVVATSERKVNGWLRTGDLATVDDDGFIYIVGRESDFVKSGGFRISTLEIEEFLKAIRCVQDVSVVGIPDSTLGEALKAYVVLVDDQNSDGLAEIRVKCRQNLPTHKIPKVIEVVSTIPQNSYGKKLKYADAPNAANSCYGKKV